VRALPVFLKELQLAVKRGRGRYEVGLGQQGADFILVQFAGRQRTDHAALRQHAEHPVEFADKNRHPAVVTGGDFALDAFQRLLQIDGLDLVPWRHHILDRHVFQLEQVDQDAPVRGRNEMTGFRHQRAQFVRRQGMPLVLIARTQARDAQQPETNRFTDQMTG
jgi:hypothetical protein